MKLQLKSRLIKSTTLFKNYLLQNTNQEEKREEKNKLKEYIKEDIKKPTVYVVENKLEQQILRTDIFDKYILNFSHNNYKLLYNNKCNDYLVPIKDYEFNICDSTIFNSKFEDIIQIVIV